MSLGVEVSVAVSYQSVIETGPTQEIQIISIVPIVSVCSIVSVLQQAADQMFLFYISCAARCFSKDAITAICVSVTRCSIYTFKCHSLRSLLLSHILRPPPNVHSQAIVPHVVLRGK